MSSYDAAQPFSEWLRAGNIDAWERMIHHRFCRDMAEDRLAEPVFVRYLRYEHAFVGAAIVVSAHALVKAPTPADRDPLLGVLISLAGEQQAYFQRTFAALGLDGSVLPVNKLPPGARGLHDGVSAIAASRCFAEILAAMLAAEWMYLTWCEQAHRCRPQRPALADWIRLHVETAFRNQVAWLKRRLDVLGPALDPSVQERCRANFGRVLELEIAFHDAPYEEA
jgi:thiaminase/transcriptional activator TenA